MTKILVATTDNTQRAGSMANGADRVAFNRPSVVELTGYIEFQMANSNLVRVYEDDLPGGATDAAWAEAYAEAKAALAEGEELDLDLTIMAWVSELPAEPEPEPAPEAGAGTDASFTAPKPGNERARSQRKTHQAPAEG